MHVVEELRSQVDRIVFLGDFVNRGPQSREVLDYLILLRMDPNLSTVMLRGNHDDALINAVTSASIDQLLLMGGAATVRNYVDAPSAEVASQLQRAFPLEHLNFLQSLEDRYETDEVIAMHALDRTRKDKFSVAGHLVQAKGDAQVFSNYALVDSGCGTTPEGRLSALVWPDRGLVVSRPWGSYHE